MRGSRISPPHSRAYQLRQDKALSFRTRTSFNPLHPRSCRRLRRPRRSSCGQTNLPKRGCPSIGEEEGLWMSSLLTAPLIGEEKGSSCRAPEARRRHDNNSAQLSFVPAGGSLFSASPSSPGLQLRRRARVYDSIAPPGLPQEAIGGVAAHQEPVKKARRRRCWEGWSPDRPHREASKMDHQNTLSKQEKRVVRDNPSIGLQTVL